MRVAVPAAAKLELKLTSTGVRKGFPEVSVRLTVTLVDPPGASAVVTPSTGVERLTFGKATEKLATVEIFAPDTVADAVTAPVPALLPANNWTVAVPAALVVTDDPLTGFKDPKVVLKVTGRPGMGLPFRSLNVAVAVVLSFSCIVGFVICSVAVAVAPWVRDTMSALFLLLSPQPAKAMNARISNICAKNTVCILLILLLMML